MHGIPMQTGQPNGVRSSDWLGQWVQCIFSFFVWDKCLRSKNYYAKIYVEAAWVNTLHCIDYAISIGIGKYSPLYT